MRVFLIHGMGRTPISMWILKRRLAALGYRPSLFGYLVTTTTLEDITRRFVAHVSKVVEEDRKALPTGEVPEPYVIIGHSLGNIVARWAMRDLPDGLDRFIMLAPPNRPPAVARALQNNWFFRATTQDAGQKLTDASFYSELPVPQVPSLIIAGTRGPRARWLPFDGKPNDSIVGVEETHLADIPTIEVPGMHTFLMNRHDVFEAIKQFLNPSQQA